jgi:propane monooxygenase coupling protein
MADERWKVDPTSSNRAGVTLMNNQVGHVVADVMRSHDNVTVEELPSMIRVDGTGQFDFDYEEIAEALGWEDFGNDDRVIMFANPEDAAEYIDFDLKPVA